MSELKCPHCGCQVVILPEPKKFNPDAGSRKQGRLNRKNALASSIRDLAAEGHSRSTISTILGYTRTRIGQICEAENIATLHGRVDHEGISKLRQFAETSAGASHAQAAKAIGRSLNFVTYNLQRHNISLPRKQTWRDRYKKCAEQGMTLTETARHFGHSVQMVNNDAKRKGCPPIVFKGAYGPRKKKDEV